MLSTVEFTKSDLKANTLVDAGWYTVELGEVTDSISQKGTSTNYVIKAVIKCATADGDTTFEDVPFDIRLNSLMKGQLVNFFIAGGVTLEPDTQYTPHDMSGKTISAHVINEEWNNRVSNKSSGNFRAL